MSKIISLCSSCPARDNERFKSDCEECKSSGMNKTEVFTQSERKTIKELISR